MLLAIWNLSSLILILSFKKIYTFAFSGVSLWLYYLFLKTFVYFRIFSLSIFSKTQENQCSLPIHNNSMWKILPKPGRKASSLHTRARNTSTTKMWSISYVSALTTALLWSRPMRWRDKVWPMRLFLWVSMWRAGRSRSWRFPVTLMYRSRCTTTRASSWVKRTCSSLFSTITAKPPKTAVNWW